MLEYLRTYNNGTVLIFDQFPNSDPETQLNAFSESVYSRRNNQSIDILSACSNDDSDKANEVSANKEPAASYFR